MSSIKSSRNPQVGRGMEETDPSPKPLAATLMQEIQNLKDKFKNEDEMQEKGTHSD
jgi:hypothetical protein